jgi:hypothetical protein
MDMLRGLLYVSLVCQIITMSNTHTHTNISLDFPIFVGKTIECPQLHENVSKVGNIGPRSKIPHMTSVSFLLLCLCFSLVLMQDAMKKVLNYMN